MTSASSDRLNLAVDEALRVGKPIILRAEGLVVLPDTSVLRAIALGVEIPDTARVCREDGREALIFTWPEREPVDLDGVQDEDDR